MSTMQPEEIRRANHAWGVVLAESLVRLGVRFAAISPGSRSTPVTVALVRHAGIEAVPVVDERSAAFLALGWARRTGEPAVVVVTSGTAAANLFPAVIEAREGRVPLLVLTTDRPPELRACAAGQTIDQVKIFGGFSKWQMDLPLPEVEPMALARLRQILAAGVARTVARAPGPVHLNLPLREPLAPEPGWTGDDVFESLNDPAFFSHLAPPAAPPSALEWPDELAAARGVIVVGTAPVAGAAARRWVDAVAAVARATGWPVFADALNPLRGCANRVPGLVTAYDAVLRTPEGRARRPEVVLQVGPWPTSKVLRFWIESLGVPVLLADDGPDRVDALAVRTRELGGGVEALALAAPPPEARSGDWLAAWQADDREQRQRLAIALAQSPPMSESRVGPALVRSLPEGALLVIANSMPVRDLEWFRPADNRGVEVLVNRGANGIDGTLSTALGAAWGAGRPVCLLTGDLAFLHDSNGLLSAGRLRGSLAVVIVDNHGGGIFENLPIAQIDPPFEEFFATPQEVDILALAAAHGVRARNLAGEADLCRAVAEPAAGVRILRWPADRKADAAWRRQVLKGGGQ